jgi:hypothetical protein
MKLASIVLSLSVSVAVHAQAFPYEAQLERLMDEPNETVSALVIYPWRDDSPTGHLLNVGIKSVPIGRLPNLTEKVWMMALRSFNPYYSR